MIENPDSHATSTGFIVCEYKCADVFLICKYCTGEPPGIRCCCWISNKSKNRIPRLPMQRKLIEMLCQNLDFSLTNATYN